MIERILKSKLIEMANKYPIVTLTGPRQSGKSTLLRNSFQDYEYVLDVLLTQTGVKSVDYKRLHIRFGQGVKIPECRDYLILYD